MLNLSSTQYVVYLFPHIQQNQNQPENQSFQDGIPKETLLWKYLNCHKAHYNQEKREPKRSLKLSHYLNLASMARGIDSKRGLRED